MTAVERIVDTIRDEIRRLDREIREVEELIEREPFADFIEGMTYRVEALREERDAVLSILRRIES